MAALHRYQWIDAQARGGRYPNAKRLAERFEISRRQAQRDFDYMRDSLGAPLVYDTLRRGYRYSRDTYSLPGPYVTPEQRSVLQRLASYYAHVAEGPGAGSATFGEMAELFGRLSGGDLGQRPPSSASTVVAGRAPYRAVILLPSASPPPALESFGRELQVEGDGYSLICEFHAPEQFLSALLAAGLPVRVRWPTWLRRQLLDHLAELQAVNERKPAEDVAGMTSGVTPPLVPSSRESQARESFPDADGANARRSPSADMTTQSKATQARFEANWTSYVGALRGVLRPAGLSDLDMSQLMGLTGMAFHLIMHEECDASSVTVYDWNGEHLSGLDRIGVLSEGYFAMPDWTTYPAACRRAVENIKTSIDRGIGVVLWGVGLPEFGVVYGYDDADGVLLVDGIDTQGTGRIAPILYENVGRSCEVPILYYHVPIERVEYDPGEAYRRSLQYYVEHMERQSNAESAHDRASAYRNGLSAYGNWIRALEGGTYSPMGLRYVTSVYADAKGHAARYLAWLAESWGGLPHLREVATGMSENADIFARMLGVLEATDDGAHLGRPVSPAQATALASLVKQARAVEEKTIALVRRSLEEARRK